MQLRDARETPRFHIVRAAAPKLINAWRVRSRMTGSTPDGSSVMTSLHELARLEAERVRELKEAEQRCEAEETARRAEEARIAREAALAHTRSLEEADERRAARARDALARVEAQKLAAIEEARVLASHRARAEEVELAHRRALEVSAVQAASPKVAPRRWVKPLLAAVVACNALFVAVVVMRAEARESAAKSAIAARDAALRDAEHAADGARDAMARMKRDLEQAQGMLAVERARPAPPCERAPVRARSSPSSNTSSDGLGTGRCDPHDPLCGTIGGH